MKKSAIGGLVAGGLAMALAPFASAQSGPAVTGMPGDGRALSIQVGGDIDLQWRYVSSSAVEAAGADNKGAAPGNQGDAFLGGAVKGSLWINAALPEKASTTIELAIPRIDGGGPGVVNTFGGDSGGAGDPDVSLDVRQAYIKLDQFLDPALTWKFGLQGYTSDIRGKGNPLVFGFRASGAESAWAESAAGIIGAPASPVNHLGTFKDEARPGGLVVNWMSGAVDLNFFHLYVTDTGSVRSTEMATGFDLLYSVDKDKKTVIEGVVALLSGTGGAGAGVLGGTGGAGSSATAGSESEVWLIGGGVVLNGVMGNVPGLDLYAQIYVNTGDYGQGNTAALPADTVDASGLMWNIGADYSFDAAWKPKVGVEYLFVSGNEIETGGASDDEYEGFVGYEDNDDLIILEDNEFGLDIDQNYKVLKLRGGITGNVFASAMQDSFTLDLVIGFATLDEDVADNTPAASMNVDDLGTEIDLKATQMLSKQVSVYAGVAMLVGADFIEDSAAINAGEDSAFTWLLGTNIKF